MPYQSENLCPLPNNMNGLSDLNDFLVLQEAQPTDVFAHSAEKWNHRADAWERERVSGRRGTDNERIYKTVSYLKERGLLDSEDDIADIGCGPGRFAVEFARTVRSVTGFDIAEKMIRYGREHAKREGVQNVAFHTRDFRTLDVGKEGLAGQFDLVFSSLTPAIHTMDALQKYIRMSRAFCCHITHVSNENRLEQQILQELFEREAAVRWNGRYFYTLWNIVFLMGYAPEASYDYRHRERRVFFDDDYVECLMEHILSPQERTEEHHVRIRKWLRNHADAGGAVTEISDTCYGRILWDVRQRSNPRKYGVLGSDL